MCIVSLTESHLNAPVKPNAQSLHFNPMAPTAHWQRPETKSHSFEMANELHPHSAHGFTIVHFVHIYCHDIPAHPVVDEKLKEPGVHVQHLSSSTLPTLGRQTQTPVSWRQLKYN